MFRHEIDYREMFRKRLTQLRLEKNVSAREMSLALGQNLSYINRIENGKTMPSMGVFINICEYLNVSPAEFFSFEKTSPSRLDALNGNLMLLSDIQINALTEFISNKKSQS